MSEKDTDSSLVKEVKKAVREDLAKRYTTEKIEHFLLLASALDPRFRSLPHLGNEQRECVFREIGEKAVSLSENVTVNFSNILSY